MNEKDPLHKRISDDLLNKILNKDYLIGEMIPKEIELAKQYNVSRPTVRQAIQTLVDDGYLERIRGTGTFVKQKKINQEFTHVIKSYNDEILSKGLIPRTEVIKFCKQKATIDISEKLNIPVGEPVYNLTRLRYASETPIVFVNTYIPAKMYPNLINEDFTKVSLYDTFTKYNYPIQQVTRELNVIKSDYMSSAMLNSPINEPLFYFKTIGYTYDNIPIEYSISWYRSEYNTFIIKLNM